MSVLLSNICRLCGEMTEDLVELFSEDGSSDYVQKIQHYLNVEIRAFAGNILQPRICHPCKEKLAKWDKYANHVLSVQEFLDSLTYASGTIFEYMVDCTLKHKEPDEISSSEPDNMSKRIRKRKKHLKATENPVPDEEIPIIESMDSCPGQSANNNRKIRLKITKIKEDEPQVTYLQDVEDGQASSDKENNDSSDDNLRTQVKEEVDESVDFPTCDEQGEVDGEEQQSGYASDGKTIPNVGEVDSISLNWECSDCKSSMASWSALARHCSEEHGTGPRVHCLCGKTLHSRGSVVKHHLKHTVGFQYKCDNCNKSYLRKRLLDMHSLSHLPKEEQPWLCCKCCRRFHSEALLKQHERMHLPPEHKSLFPCQICHKKLCSKSAVASHIRSVHLRERPFVCDQCGLSFTSKGILDEHLNVHSDIYNYHCKDCGKSFKTKYRLRIHVDTHLETRYICPVCGLSLNTRRTLRMHLLVHEDRKDFNCGTCGKAFKRSKDLKNHVNMHTGRRPYTCPFCSRTFANGSNCRSHKRRMHPEELRLYEEAVAAGVDPPPLHKVELSFSQDGASNVDAVVPQQQTLLVPLNLKNQPGALKDEDEDEDDLEAIISNEASLTLQYSLPVFNTSSFFK